MVQREKFLLLDSCYYFIVNAAMSQANKRQQFRYTGEEKASSRSFLIRIILTPTIQIQRKSRRVQFTQYFCFLRAHSSFHWRRKWQPTPVVLPGKSHGFCLVGYCPRGRKESETTEQLHSLHFLSLNFLQFVSIFAFLTLLNGFNME